MGVILMEARTWDEARRELEKAMASSRDFHRIEVLVACLAARQGRKAEVRKRLAELLDLAERRYIFPLDPAQGYTAIGDADQAHPWLEKSFVGRTSWMVSLKHHPAFAPLPGDRRVVELVCRVEPG